MLGVFDERWVEPYAQALLNLGSDRAWVVHGRDGMDEISTTGPTIVAEIIDNGIRVFELTPEDMGLSRASLDDLRGGSAAANADALQAVLKGEPGPFADLVAANAAAALVVSGLAPDIKAGIALARDGIARGAALAALETLVRSSNG